MINGTEKERLIKSDISSIENRVRHAFNQGYDLGYKKGIEKGKKQSKTGYWIERPNGFKCSKCLIIHKHHSIYCPSCGARMIEAQERSNRE